MLKALKLNWKVALKHLFVQTKQTAERVEDITSVISVGDSIEAKYTGVDRKSRVVNLSVRAKNEAEESAAIAQVNKEEVVVPNAFAEAFKAAKGE